MKNESVEQIKNAASFHVFDDGKALKLEARKAAITQKRVLATMSQKNDSKKHC